LFNLYCRSGIAVKETYPGKDTKLGYSDSHVQFFAPFFYPDPDYPMDSYRISKPHGVIPMVTISAIYPLFPTPQKSHDLIFTDLPGMHDFYRQSSNLKTCLGCRLVGVIRTYLFRGRLPQK